MPAPDPAVEPLRSPWRRALLAVRGPGFTPAWLINAYLNTVARLSLPNYWYWRKWRDTTADADRLHLGSGAHYLPDWINIEALLFWKRDLWLDLRYGLPFADGTIRAIYANQVLEHFPLPQGRRLLAECHRVLRRGGVLRVAVPSYPLAAEAFARGDADFFRPLVPAETHGSLSEMLNAFLLCGGHHRVLFDPPLLRDALERVGTWEWIREPDPGASEVLDADELDFAEGTHGVPLQTHCVVLEARKL